MSFFTTQPTKAKTETVAASAPRDERAQTSRWWRIVAIVVLLGYGGFLESYFTAVAGGSDSSGYLNFADLMIRGQLTDDLREVPGFDDPSTFATVPLGFTPAVEPGRLAPTYPSGMALQYAAAERLVGRVAGVHLVGIGGALLAIALCYAVGRELGLSRALAGASAAMLAINPVFVFIAIQPLSDVLATMWCLAALFGVLRARQSAGWGVFAGAAAAMAVLVRPTNVLVFPALLVLMPSWRALGWFVAGGVPGGAWMLWYQNALYGSPWVSGYGDIRAHFRWSNLAPTAAHYAEWLPRFVPVIWILGAVGVVRCWSATARAVLALGAWVVAIGGFYLFYDVTQETWWCLRFVLPAMPALILAGALGFACLAAHLRGGWARAGRWGVAAMVVWSGLLGGYWGKRLNVTGTAASEPPYQELALWTKEHLPARATVACMVASGAVHYYTKHAVLRWDMITRDRFQAFATSVDLTTRPVYALLFREEEREALNERLPGRWEKIYENSRGAVWRLVAAAP